MLLVNDLSTARRILDRPAMRSVSSIVTLAGDIVRPGGAITGGSPSVRSSGLLEREREFVDLPKRIAAAKTAEQAQQLKLSAAQATLRQAEERLVRSMGGWRPCAGPVTSRQRPSRNADASLSAGSRR